MKRLLYLLPLAACVPDGVPFDPGAGVCRDAAERLGYLACTHHVPDEQAWRSIAAPLEAIDQLRGAKHLVPLAHADTDVTPLLVNSQRFALHSDFLRVALPASFPGVSSTGYAQLVLAPGREFVSGNVVEVVSPSSGERFFGFTIWDYPEQPLATLSLDEATQAWEALLPIVEGFTSRLTFVPVTSNQAAAAAGWDAPFEVQGLDTALTYEAYNEGEAYGTVRRVAVQDLQARTASGELGWRDILVLDEAPYDLERVVSGIVTGSRQTGLSHLNVRSVARGTPNCFVAGAHAQLEQWEGQLVRARCAETRLLVTVADPADAERWWAQQRPSPVQVPAPDLSTTDMPGLLELPTDSASQRAAGVAAYGSKGTNLAVLYQRVDPSLQLQGMLVPASAYAQFMQQGTWTVDLGQGPAEHSFASTLHAWHSEPAPDFAGHSARLQRLRAAMLEAPVDPELLGRLSAQIEARWGNDLTMVRFRSSSNAEDALGFSGAGLYESASACVADEWDDDADGPSLCDPSKSRERSLSNALREIWASLWLPGASDERDWYGIDPAQVAMAVLVNDRSADEQAEAVVFSGDPVLPNDRVRIDAQVGEIGVVAPESGVVPELLRVRVNAQGEVTNVQRVQDSSEVSPGAWVLSHEELVIMASVVAGLSQVLPLDASVPQSRDLLYDTEWKVLSDGRVVVKQVRPFLR